MNFVTEVDKDINRKNYYRSITFMNMNIRILNQTANPIEPYIKIVTLAKKF